MFRDPPVPPVNNSPAGAPVRVDNPGPAVIARSHEPVTPAQQRWNDQMSAAEKADPWINRDVVLTRDAEGKIIASPRIDGGSNGTPASGDQPASPGDQQPQQAAPDRIRVGDLELTADELKGLMERRGLEESRKATLPKDAAAYELTLPNDFVMPEGQTYKFATDDPVLGPLLGQAKQVAHDLGIDQSGFSRLLDLFAASQINEQRMIAAAGKKELAKLGENATIRVDAVRTFLRGHLGDELAGALQRGMHTERQVVAYEKLMMRFQGQGGGNWSGANREPPHKPGTVTDEQYNRMSYTERKNYAAQFEHR
jgi:hypothetical protein